jgi:hypothetical protein
VVRNGRKKSQCLLAGAVVCCGTGDRWREVAQMGLVVQPPTYIHVHVAPVVPVVASLSHVPAHYGRVERAGRVGYSGLGCTTTFGSKVVTM